jgi:cyclohexanone monooxygenase
MIGGPGSPSVLVNVIMGNEYQVAWISQMIKHMRDNGYTRVDVDPDHQDQWARTVKNAIEGTVFTTSDSWYVGANVKGKARGILAYAGGFANYVKACDGVADRNYEGFEFSV